MLVLSLIILASLSACVSRTELNAVLFMHEQIPEAICKDNPELMRLGIYRIFNCTPQLIEVGVCAPDQTVVRERISYCKPGVVQYFSIKDSDLEEILKKARIRDK